jgi:hypothetical protein
VSEWLLLNTNSAIFQLYYGENKLIFNEARFVLDQHAELDFNSASSLKQQSAGRHVAPLGHIILILSQPVFALSPYCCVLSGEATNTNFIVFGLIRLGLEPMIYRTRGEHANHYPTDAVLMSSQSVDIQTCTSNLTKGDNFIHFFNLFEPYI